MFGAERWLDAMVHFFPSWANILEPKLIFKLESGPHSFLLCDLTLDQPLSSLCLSLIEGVGQS